jgi:hypothetical protein
VQGFVWAALAAVLAAGLRIGAHLTFVLGFGFPVSIGFASFVQTHRHVQMVGWTGLMIMGSSLHVLPRLAGVALAAFPPLRWIWWLISSGLVVRCLGQPLLPYLMGTAAFPLCSWLVVLSGVLEDGGVLLYIRLLLRTFWQVSEGSQRPALLAVRPYFGMMVSGWALYAGANVVLLLSMVWHAEAVVHPAWNHWAIESFQGLTLLPVAFAFSVRMLPLYLHLAVPDQSVRSMPMSI